MGGPIDLATGRPTERRAPFRFSAVARVWFSDTDAQGIVYYGRFLPYFDHARREYHRHLELLEVGHGGSEFVMKALAVEYVASARFDDLLEVFTRTVRIGRTSVTSEYEAYRVVDDTLICRATQTVVLVDGEDRRPTPVPERYREVVTAFEGAPLDGSPSA